MCALLCAWVLALGALPALADNPFGPLPQNAPVTPTTATTSSTASTTGGSLSTGALVAIFVGGAAIIGAIAYVIMRDARTTAPSRRGIRGPRATVAPRADRIKRSRAKEKAARRARRASRS